MPHRLFCALSALAASAALFAQQGSDPGEPKPRPSAQIPAAPLYKLEDALLQWQLAPQDKAYAAIDGHRIHSYVEDLTAISRKYRDSGHPQFWGRIIGTQADTDTRKSMFAAALRAHVPLAAAIRRTLDERWNHRAAAVRFRDELEDHMSPDYADGTLRAVITWGRYAELFSYDEETGQFSLEDMDTAG